jgi:hypothetical protein
MNGDNSIWKEATMTHFKILFRNWPGKTGEDLERLVIAGNPTDSNRRYRCFNPLSGEIDGR